MTAREYRLGDRYTAESGQVLLSGIQALARIPIEQIRRDRAVGRNTATFVSGYPGSPLGGLDQELTRAVAIVPDLPIIHLPAVNEELAASAVMGSQLVATRPDARYDGVIGIWYGKAPGLDRETDALRHGVFAGSSPTGGALVIVGDDPASFRRRRSMVRSGSHIRQHSSSVHEWSTWRRNFTRSDPSWPADTASRTS